MSRLSNRGAPAAEEKELVILVANRPVAVRTAIRTASRLSRLQPRAQTNDRGGRVIFGITHDDHSASTGFDLVALGDALHRVVRALRMKIGTYFADDRAHILFWEHYDGVHVRQRRQNFRAFFGRNYWPTFALQRAYGSIGIHRNNQLATEFPRGTQVTYVADVQQIENTVSQCDAMASAPPVRNILLKFVARNNLLME